MNIARLWDNVDAFYIVRGHEGVLYMKPANPFAAAYKNLRTLPDWWTRAYAVCQYIKWEQRCNDPANYLRVSNEEHNYYAPFVGFKFSLANPVHPFVIVDAEFTDHLK